MVNLIRLRPSKLSGTPSAKQKHIVLHRLWCQSIRNASRAEIISAAVSKTNIPLKDLLLRKLLRDDVDDPASHGQETDVAGVFFSVFFSFFLLKKCCDHQICRPPSGLELSKQPQQVNLKTTVCTTMNVCQRTTCSHCSNCRGIFFETTEKYHNSSAFFF